MSKINHVSLKNFTAFAELDQAVSPGVNVIQKPAIDIAGVDLGAQESEQVKVALRIQGLHLLI